MKLPLAALLVAGIAAGGLAFAQDKGKMEKKKGAAKGVTVRLAAQNKSGQSGTARLTPMGDKTRVDISMKPGAKGVAQPAHIHDGACPKPDPKPKYGLHDVVDGKSSSEVPVSLEALLKEKLAINVHKSKEEVKVYVACGNIARARGAKKKDAGKKMDK
jgi:hypothetical protein